MQTLLNWTLEMIRKEESGFSWMEEYRYEWVPLVKNAVSKIIEGQTVLMLTDSEHRWFGRYVTTKINLPEHNRPFFPIYPLTRIFPNLSSVVSTQEIEALEDMLDISFANGYFIWYIGKADHSYTKLVYHNEDNLLWVVDEQVQNSFLLRGKDESRDIKLLQLYKLFNKTIDAVLCGDLEL